MADDIFASLLEGVSDGSVKLAAPEPEPDPIFSGLMDEAKRQEQGRNSVAAKRGMEAVPEQYADHLQMSKQFGVPVDFVGRNEKELKAFKGFADLTTLMDQNPPLAKWYTNEDNPAAIKYDELRHLDGLSWLYQAGKASLVDSYNSVSFNDLQYKKMMGTASGEDLLRITQMEATQEPRTYGADGRFEKGFVGAAAQLPVMADMIIGGVFRGIQGAVYGGGAAALAGQVGPQVAFPEEVITVPAGMAAGYAYGAIAGAYERNAKQMSGAAFYEFASMKDETGAAMDNDVARVAALIAGTSGAALDTLSFHKMTSIIPGLDKVTGALSKDAIKAALMRPNVRQALSNFAKNIATTGAVETATETLQEAIQIFVGEASKSYENATDGNQFTLATGEEVRDRLADTFDQTLNTMLVLGPAMAGSRLGSDVRRANRAGQDMQMIEAINNHAQGNELNVRLPEKSKEAIRSLTENGPIEHVYVAPEAFSTYFQTSEEASQFAATVGLTDEYNEAMRTGRDMEVPIDSYYVNIAGTEIGEAIKGFVKFAPENMSMNEATDFNEAWQEAQERLAADEQASMAVDSASIQGEEKVFDDVKAKAMNAGIVPDQAAQYAKLYSQFFRTMAARTGQDAHELYSAYGFDVKRSLPSETGMRAVDNLDLALEVMRRGKIDPLRKKVDKASGPSLLEAIIARGGIVDQGGELAAMDAPKRLVRPSQIEFDSSLWTGAETAAGDFNEFSADDVARQMWEEGYFPEFEDRPTSDDLFNAIREALSGQDRFSASYDRRGEPAMQQTAGLVAFVDMLDQLGIDPAALDNDQVRAAIDAAVNADPETGALFQRIAALPESGSLSTPRVPTAEEMAASSKVEAVDLAMVRGTNRLEWERFEAGDHPGALIEGYGDMPVVGRREDGEFITFDGHHRIALALEHGDVTMDMHVIDVKDYDPQNAGRKPAASTISDDDLLNELFQSTPATADDVAALEADLIERHGLRSLSLFLSNSGDLKLNMIAVDKDKQGQGTGSQVMQELIDFADANGLRMILRTGEKDDGFGTTSGARLKKFYKGFGFVENKGRNKDFAISENMYREPVERELFQTATPEFKAWFGDSKVVDEAGNPLVVYHGTAADFSEFSKSADAKHIDLPGFYFTPDAGIAERYAESASRKEFRDADGYIAGYEGAAVMPVFLSIQNPATIALDDRQTGNMSGHAEVRAALTAAMEAGHDGAVITGWADGSGDVQYVAFEPGQIKSVNNVGAFDPSDPRILNQEKGVKRGSIQLAKGRTIINMFDQADLSTFLHESGHFFLEVFRDLADVQPKREAGAQGPESQIVEDWNKVREYLGIGDDGAISTEAHEKWARSFEAYLFEGKAPSNDVAASFARFRSWLTFVYQSITKLNAPVNDKIRAVMDRLLATDEEIEAAKRSPEFRPAFQTQEQSGMTDSQWKDYVAVAGRAVDRAKRELDARLMQEIARETTKEWRDAKKAIRDTVQASTETMPVYRAIEYLRSGKGMPEGTPRLFLDAKSINEVMGEGGTLKMPKSVPPLYRAKGGVHPDLIAELFGFNSGHEMLTRIMSVPTLAKAVVEETNMRMRRQFGDLMGDAVARARVAAEAISNDDTGELLNAEIGVLLKKGLATTSVNKADARRLARELVRGKTIREALRIKLYQNADAKAAAEAERAIIKGDWTAALAAKKRQLLNHYMAMEAAQAEKDTQAAVAYLNKFTGRKQPKGIWHESLDQIAGLLSRFDLRKAMTLTQEQRRASLAGWITQQEEAGELVVIPDVVRNDAFRKPYRQMTVDDLLAVRDAVKNIEHIGRRWEAVYGDIEARKFNLKRDEIGDAIAASQKLKPADKTRNPTKFGDALNQAKSIEAALLKMESVFDWMDSKDSNGPLRRLIWEPIAQAETAENDLRIKIVGEFQRIMGKLDPKRLNERISIPGLPQSYLRSDIMSVALNMGNESNLDKLKRGELWTDQTLELLVSHLNADEAHAVQGILNTINSLWPDIAALQRRLTGVEPEKIEPREFEIAGVKMAGGYYPMIYDPRRSPDIADRAAAANDVVRFENTYLRPETRHGFTKERSQQFTRPLLLDISGAARHLTAVIHDVTHREAILESSKLLATPRVREEIEGRYGREVYQQMVPWLQSIAFDAYKDDGLSAVENVFRGVRSRATIVAMGYRISTILTQLAGYSSALEMVPAKSMVGAIKDFTVSPLDMWNEVNKKSGMMRYRSSNLDRDINEQLKTLTGKDSALDQVRKFSFYGIGWMDRIVTVPTWTAAYRDHLQKMPNDEAGAISHADKVVSLTQGGGGPKDLAAIQRKNELTKLVTMFYSYFSSYYNRQRTWGRDVKRKWDTGEGDLASLLARQVFMTIGPAVLSELMLGRGPDDDESWAAWAGKKIAFYPLSAVPIMRDAVNVFDNGFGYSFTPSSRAIDETLIQPVLLGKKIAEGKATPRAVVKQTLETTAYALKLPLGQLATTIDNVWKAIEKDDFKLLDLVISRQHK